MSKNIVSFGDTFSGSGTCPCGERTEYGLALVKGVEGIQEAILNRETYCGGCILPALYDQFKVKIA